jgi:hypothetical protein
MRVNWRAWRCFRYKDKDHILNKNLVIYFNFSYTRMNYCNLNIQAGSHNTGHQSVRIYILWKHPYGG